MGHSCRRLTTLILLLPLALSGCAGSASMENRAYVLALGVDRAGEGLRLTVRVPKTGGSPEDSHGTEGAGYLTCAAEGANYADALATLSWSLPRRLSLSHILLLTFSEEVAGSEACAPLIDQLMQTRNLYAAAQVVVCSGHAADYIARLQPVLGERLSAEIEATLAHYESLGFMADATLAELYYAAHSGCADAVAAWAGAVEEDTGDIPVPLPDDATPAGDALSLGSAVFCAGKLAMRLDAGETLCLNLIRGSQRSVQLAWNGAPVELAVTRCRRQVHVVDGHPELRVEIHLSSLDPLPADAPAALEHALCAACVSLIGRCQRLGAEPFGFTEVASRHFLTLDSWQAWDWRSLYTRAPVVVRVRIQR